MLCRKYLINLMPLRQPFVWGSAKKTAIRTASENLSKPSIQIRISELMKERSDRYQIDTDHALRYMS
ncbi:terminase small subunit [Morganella morganii subsp. morganii]|nr:terminase small subunit [Morganella morganii subsp. morganii]